MTIDERLERLTTVVEPLAASVVEHDDQIGALIQVAEKHSEQFAETREAIATLEKQWQAYLNTLPRN
jgi:hypothetical protein